MELENLTDKQKKKRESNIRYRENKKSKESAPSHTASESGEIPLDDRCSELDDTNVLDRMTHTYCLACRKGMSCMSKVVCSELDDRCSELDDPSADLDDLCVRS